MQQPGQRIREPERINSAVTALWIRQRLSDPGSAVIPVPLALALCEMHPHELTGSQASATAGLVPPLPTTVVAVEIHWSLLEFRP
jgi:hypothetical protein